MMQRSPGLVPVVLLAAFAAFAGGCGRPTLPGQQFKGERHKSPGAMATEAPLPEEPIREWGPPDAKVQLVAYYPLDDQHQRLVDLLREAAEEKYPGKLYVKYVDPRTPEGLALMRSAELQVQGITVNGESSVDLDTPAGVRAVDLLRDMGRYWTAEDLAKVIDQEVGKAYGREAVPSPTE